MLERKVKIRTDELELALRNHLQNTQSQLVQAKRKWLSFRSINNAGIAPWDQ